jgi:two-component system response regulator AtoC
MAPPGAATERRGRRFGNRYLTDFAPLLEGSAAMLAARDIIEGVAETSATVLIRGESGVGKDLVARAIHAASPRSEQTLVKVNCAALPGELLESELFGHEKGAFTGAHRRKLGKFEFAHKGTIFLDEIGELPAGLQAKLLHVLQDFEFSRIGGRELIRVDVRVIAATNRDLEEALENRSFREDLYYRLNVVELRVPPLRERRQEIPGLVAMFLRRFNAEYDRVVTLTADTVEVLSRYSWPGNVRELENAIRRVVVLENPRQLHKDIAARIRATTSRTSVTASALDPVESPTVAGEQPSIELGLREIARRAARQAERRALAEVLERVRWNRLKAARILKVSYKTLLTKIADCGLSPSAEDTDQP